MLLGDLCTYVIINIINITVYLMLLLLTVFRIKELELKTCLKAFKERFFVRALVIINFGIHFHFYTRHVYRFKISVIGLLDL